MKCPSCSATLQMTERQGVEIDYCPDCRGVWLDRGELDKIIERAGREMQAPPAPPQAPPQYSPPHAPPPPPPQYGHHGRDDHYYKKKRKKSFLEEIFD